jgi:hypothetical protein
MAYVGFKHRLGMNRLFFAAWIGIFGFAALAQAVDGTISLNNRTQTGDVPISRASGEGMGMSPYGATAQLFVVATNGALIPLFPTTTFRTSNVAGSYFLLPVVVPVPGKAPGSSVTVILRAWENGFDYPGMRWESLPLTVTLGGGKTPEGGTLPAAWLNGLEGGRPLTPTMTYIQSIVRGDDALHFSFFYQYPSNPQPAFTVESSVDMVHWQSAVPTWGETSQDPIRQFTLPLEGNEAAGFFRVRMEAP